MRVCGSIEHDRVVLTRDRHKTSPGAMLGGDVTEGLSVLLVG